MPAIDCDEKNENTSVREGVPTTPSSSTPTTTFETPYEWPSFRKWIFVCIVSYCDCLTFLVSMMLAPSIPQVLETFRPHGGDKPLGSFCVTVYILGFCIGPLLLGPLSDIYGRTPLLRSCIIFFLLFTIACAKSTSLEMLIAFRFFAGIFGGAPMSIGGAVVADMFPSGKRGRPMACYTFGTMMGPTLGPVLGGIVNGTLDWRWVFWIASILTGVCAAGLVFVLRETHLPTIEARRAVLDGRSRNYLDVAAMFKTHRKDISIARTLTKALTIPAQLAFRHVHVFLVLVFWMVFNGMVNMILSSLGSVYQSQYDFPPVTAGLAYLGIGVGGILALVSARRICDWFARRQGGREHAKEPEHTIPLLLITGPLFSIGLIWYGWAVERRAFWFIPILGLSLFGYGYMSARFSTQMFLIEATPGFSGSALAAHTVANSIGGAVIPLSTYPLYGSVGYGWGNSVIALVSLALCIIPLILFLLARGRHVSWKVHMPQILT